MCQIISMVFWDIAIPVVFFVVANLLTILLVLSAYQSLVNAFKRTFVYRTVAYILSMFVKIVTSICFCWKRK